MNILCVIPVRGGSKGVPGKNWRPIAGRPLVAWTISRAREAEADLDVVVSTDDPFLARIARDAGAEVPFLRPAVLARDDTPTEPVVLHAIAQRTAAGRRPEAVLLLQATSPVRLPGTIDRAIEQFIASEVDSLVGVVRQTPFLWRQGEPPTPHYEVRARPRRQELSDSQFFYRETGSLYLTRTTVYQESGNRLGGRVGLFVMDDVEGVDVDTDLDFAVAEQQLLHLPPAPNASSTSVETKP